MRPTVLTPLSKGLEVTSTQRLVQLSSERKNKIEEFWKTINRENSFHRGEVYCIHSIAEQDDTYKITLNTTDYAHYLYTVRNNITDIDGCKIVFGAGLVETKDSKFVFGEMAAHTAYPGRLQCAGGGLSKEDKKGIFFDVKKSVLREITEELGIDNDKYTENCTPVLIKKGGTYDFFVILYHVKVNLLEKDLLHHYKIYAEELLSNDEKPEFQKIICVENSKEAVTNFFEKDNRPREEYLRPFLEYMAK